jgi:hypothetical protein
MTAISNKMKAFKSKGSLNSGEKQKYMNSVKMPLFFSVFSFCQKTVYTL